MQREGTEAMARAVEAAAAIATVNETAAGTATSATRVPETSARLRSAGNQGSPLENLHVLFPPVSL